MITNPKYKTVKEYIAMQLPDLQENPEIVRFAAITNLEKAEAKKSRAKIDLDDELDLLLPQV